MLPKQNRINKKNVDQVFKTGRFITLPNLTFKYVFSKTTKGFPILSFITPKTVSKSAVKRNLLRRLGYTALRDYLEDFPSGLVGVFVFRKYQDNVLVIKDEIKNILRKLN